LMGDAAESSLEIGLATSFTRPESGYFVVMRKPAEDVVLSELTVSSDYRLLGKDGRAITDSPYVLVAIEASPQRDDWFQIPELAGAYETLQEDVSRGRLEVVKESLAVFKRATLTCSDLLVADAVRLVEKVVAEIDQVLRLTQTAGESPTLPSLKEVALYE
jgi:hypothetical protein